MGVGKEGSLCVVEGPAFMASCGAQAVLYQLEIDQPAVMCSQSSDPLSSSVCFACPLLLSPLPRMAFLPLAPMLFGRLHLLGSGTK